MDILNLSEDLLERSSQIFLFGIEERTNASVKFIKEEYHNKVVLYKMIDFVQDNFYHMLKADFSDIERIDNFPMKEAFYELQHSINHALIGSYKAAFADLRRSIELTLTIPFFTKENMNKYASDETSSFEAQLQKFDAINDEEIKKANNWLKGESDTPFFGGMLREIFKDGRFKMIKEECGWDEKIKKLYYKISDLSHNKGYRHSYDVLNAPTMVLNSMTVPATKVKTLSFFCDVYIETVTQNLIIMALYNPVVLEGLPIEQKFGFNEPASGFFCHAQSELLWELLPKEYHQFFNRIRTTDSEVLDVVKWVMDRPDVSPEEFELQINQFNSLIASLSSKNS